MCYSCLVSGITHFDFPPQKRESALKQKQTATGPYRKKAAAKYCTTSINLFTIRICFREKIDCNIFNSWTPHFWACFAWPWLWLSQSEVRFSWFLQECRHFHFLQLFYTTFYSTFAPYSVGIIWDSGWTKEDKSKHENTTVIR